MRRWYNRRAHCDPHGSGADIVLPHAIDGDTDPRLQKAIDIFALQLRRHIKLCDVALVHLESRTTFVYVVQ